MVVRWAQDAAEEKISSLTTEAATADQRWDAAKE
jgi:hypothetical protein